MAGGTLFKRFALLAALLLAATSLSAQTTKVRGRVTDESGEAVPFVAVFFEGTTVGITTDLDGWYRRPHGRWRPSAGPATARR